MVMSIVQSGADMIGGKRVGRHVFGDQPIPLSVHVVMMVKGCKIGCDKWVEFALHAELTRSSKGCRRMQLGPKAVRQALLGIAVRVGRYFAPSAYAGPFEAGWAAYNKGNYATAVRRFKLAAHQGDATAQSNLGWMYYSGSGVTQNKQEAARLYKLAAHQGVANAQINLGAMYYNGTGVTQDYILAHMWFNLAAPSLEGPDRKIATTNRDDAAGKMTPAQIERAQSMARVCRASNFKNCGY